MLTFTDCGVDAGQIVDDRASPTPVEVGGGEERRRLVTVLLEGCEAWSMVEHAQSAVLGSPCGVCKGRPKFRHYCLACDKLGGFTAAQLPGLICAPDWKRIGKLGERAKGKPLAERVKARKGKGVASRRAGAA